MIFLNTVSISGRLSATPERRLTRSGKTVCVFSVAVQRPWAPDTADFFNCIAWEKQAEFLIKYFTKGQHIEIVGTLIQQRWKDKKGYNRSKVEIECNQIFFGDGRTAEKAKEWPVEELTEDDYIDIPSDLPF